MAFVHLHLRPHPRHKRPFLSIDDPGHPLCRVFDGQGFMIHDEIYQFTRIYSRANLRVLLSLDTLRADHLGAYGGPVATPHLDALAARGYLFEQATSGAPLTLPAHASLLTGVWPERHGVMDNGQVRLSGVEPDSLWHVSLVLRCGSLSLGLFTDAASRGIGSYWVRPTELGHDE